MTEDLLNRAVVVVYVFSGVHFGAKIELPVGSWLLGSDDSCDIILNDLEPRHALLEIAHKPQNATNNQTNNEKTASDLSSNSDQTAKKNINNATFIVKLSPLDGTIRLEDSEPLSQANASQTSSLELTRGNAWYLDTICFAWNLPNVKQQKIVPSLSNAKDNSKDNPEAKEPTEASNNKSAETKTSSTATANNISTSKDNLDKNGKDKGELIQKNSGLVRFALLAILAILLIALSIHFTPDVPKQADYPDIVLEQLQDLGLQNLSVSAKNSGVEVIGVVSDDQALFRLSEMARNLRFPLYLNVVVREDILRATRASLTIRGLYPKLELQGNPPLLKIASYIRDEALENFVFKALANEINDLPKIEKKIVYEKDLAPIFEMAIKAENLNVDTIFLPGQIDFSGIIKPEDEAKLERIRRDVSQRFAIPLVGELRTGRKTEITRPEVTNTSKNDALGGIQIASVTTSPMRFVVTDDGQRLFEGARLPSGYILEQIDTKVLKLRRGNDVVTHVLQGSE